MKKNLLLAGLASLFLFACGTPEKRESFSESSASISREHCLSKDNNASCFLEIESNGKKSFYAPDRDYEALLTSPVLAEMNLPIKELDTGDYAELVNRHGPATFVYNELSDARIDAYANTSEDDQPELNGWWDSWGRRTAKGISGALTGALTGAATGAGIGSVIPGIGTVIGAIGGGVIGAISGGLGGVASNSRSQLVYHYGKQSKALDVSLDKLEE